MIAVDTAGRSSNPAQEISFVPQSVPAAPAQFAFQRRLRGATLTWSPNLELDIAGYNLYRTTFEVHIFQKVNAAIIADTNYADTDLSFQKYFYYATAVDLSGFESLPSSIVTLRPITLERGPLLIDETRDGNGTLAAPTDEQVDTFYRSILPHIGFEEYDVARSGVPDDTLGLYATLIWHADLPSNNSLPAIAPFLKEYMEAGGQLLLSGWNVLRGFLNGTQQAFDQEHFVAQYLHIDTAWVANSPQFEAALGVNADYGSLSVDSAKIPVPAWNGLLREIDVFAPAADADAVFHFVANDTTYLFNYSPVGVKHFGSKHHVMTLGFPLYFMQEEQARAALRWILVNDFGHRIVSVQESRDRPVPRAFALRQNHPNPWASDTRFRFEVPQASRITIEVFDILGRLLVTVLDTEYEKGVHETVLPRRFLQSGVYFYRLTARRQGTVIHQQARKMVIVH